MGVIHLPPDDDEHVVWWSSQQYFPMYFYEPESVCRKQAFKDYLRLEKPSIAGLLRYYDENPKRAVTKKADRLSKWREEDAWDRKHELFHRDIISQEMLREDVEKEIERAFGVYDDHMQEELAKADGFADSAYAKQARLKALKDAQSTVNKLISFAEKHAKEMEKEGNAHFYYEKVFPQAVRLLTLLNKEERVERGEAGDRVTVSVEVRDMIDALPESMKQMVIEKLEAKTGKPLALPDYVDAEFRRDEGE